MDGTNEYPTYIFPNSNTNEQVDFSAITAHISDHKVSLLVAPPTPRFLFSIPVSRPIRSLRSLSRFGRCYVVILCPGVVRHFLTCKLVNGARRQIKYLLHRSRQSNVGQIGNNQRHAENKITFPHSTANNYYNQLLTSPVAPTSKTYIIP